MIIGFFSRKPSPNGLTFVPINCVILDLQITTLLKGEWTKMDERRELKDNRTMQLETILLGARSCYSCYWYL